MDINISCRSVMAVVIVSAGLALSACSHYRVTDPSSNAVYYTKEIKHKGNGAAQFKDARTGDKVTIQNSEVTKISEREYKNAVRR